MGTEAEVLDGLTGVLGTTEEEGVASGRSTESKLVQSQSLTAGSQDASAGSGSEAKSSHGALGELEKTVVVGDGSNNDNGLVVGLGLLGSVGGNAGQRHGGSVDLGEEQTTQDDLVERGIGTT